MCVLGDEELQALSACHKNKGFLVSPIKVYITALQRSRSITQCRAIALTCRIGAAGCWRIGGTMVTLFCCFLACGEKREELGRWTLGLQLTKNKRPRVSPLVFNGDEGKDRISNFHALMSLYAIYL